MTVTVCAADQSSDVKVSSSGLTMPSVVSPLSTPMVTSSTGSLSSFTVNVAVKPASVVVSSDPAVTVTPAASSSSLVNDTSAGLMP